MAVVELDHMPRSRRGALAALLLVLVLMAGGPSEAGASTTVDVRGQWDCTSSAGSGCSYAISAEDFSSGSFSGTGSSSGGPFHVSGTLSGSSFYMETPYDNGFDHPYYEGTVSSDGNTMSGKYGSQPCNQSPDPCGGSWSYTRSGPPPDDNSPPPDGNGGGQPSKQKPTMSMGCNYNSFQRVDLCLVDVSGNPAATGSVDFSVSPASGGSFTAAPARCTLGKISDFHSQCAVQYRRGNKQVVVSASYGGDDRWAGASASNSVCGDLRLGAQPCGAAETDPFKTVCVSLWVGDCTGFLPAPDPIQVCVSAWENCNGFGGRGPAAPGTIDLSGFPDELKTPVKCKAAKPDSASPKDLPGQASSPKSCTVLEYMNDRSTKRSDADDSLQYNTNLALFNAKAESVRSELTVDVLTCMSNDLQDPNRAPACRAWLQIERIVVVRIRSLIDAAEQPGAPVTKIEPPLSAEEVTNVCAPFMAQADRDACTSFGTTAGSATVEALNELRDFKHKLGVDVPFKPRARGSSRARAGAARVRSARRFRGPHVIGFGSVKVPAGGRKTLHMRLPRWVRAELRRAKRRGRRQVKVAMTIDVHAISGLHYARTSRLLLLLRPRRHHRP